MAARLARHVRPLDARHARLDWRERSRVGGHRRVEGRARVHNDHVHLLGAQIGGLRARPQQSRVSEGSHTRTRESQDGGAAGEMHASHRAA